MKEFTYRKSPWRFLLLAVAIWGGWSLLSNLVAMLVASAYLHWSASANGASSVGVIGGADGPTAIFVTTPGWTHLLWPLVLVIVGVWGYRRLRRGKQN